MGVSQRAVPAPNALTFLEATSVKGEVEHELRHAGGATQAEDWCDFRRRRPV